MGLRLQLCITFTLSECDNVQTNMVGRALDISKEFLNICGSTEHQNTLTFLQMFTESLHMHIKSVLKHISAACGLICQKSTKVMSKTAFYYMDHTEDLKYNMFMERVILFDIAEGMPSLMSTKNLFDSEVMTML